MILGAARHEFKTSGYHATKVADIAKVAGVSRATVYNHFNDKRDILWALVGEFLQGYERASATISREAAAKERVFDVLLHMVEGMLLWRVDNADLRPAVEAARQLFAKDFAQADQAADEAIKSQLTEVHRWSAQRGLIREDIDVDFATSVLYGMVEAAVSSTDVRSSRDDTLRVARQLALLQWYAVYNIPPESSPPYGG